MNFALPFPARFSGRPDYDRRFQLALVLSALLHLVVVFGMTFKTPDLSSFKNNAAPLEVVLVNSKSATRPVKADVLAQANLDGGGNTDLDRRAKSPLPVLSKSEPQPEVKQASRRVQELEQQARKLMTQIRSSHSIDSAESKVQQPMDPVVAPNAADLVERSLAMARLEAQVSRDWDSYQKRPKRKFVGARAQEYVFARYVEDWRAKVERVGNLNYPEAAKQQKLYGSLQLTVSIRADGSVEKVEINRSSGSKILDAAAIRIVELAAPYAPFSEEMRSKVDILGITRTWIFTKADQLASGD